MSTDGPDLGWPEDTALVELGEVTSTMDEAAKRAVIQPTWISATHQSGARGRGGKAWRAPAGNLNATWTAPADLPLAELPQYSFVAALALFDTLATWIAKDQLAVKWPNDVLAQGQKIAGILLESSGGRLSIGIGINVVTSPPVEILPEHALPTVAMADLADRDAPLPLRADWVLAQLAWDFERWRGHLRNGDFPSLLQIWKGRAANLGKPIRVVMPNQTLTGVFQDVDDTGCLILHTPDGSRKIAAGDVFFGE